MTEIPTVRIKSENPLGYAIINQSDYDASVHELYDDEPKDSEHRPVGNEFPNLEEEAPAAEELPTTDETEQPARKRRERKSEIAE